MSFYLLRKYYLCACWTPFIATPLPHEEPVKCPSIKNKWPPMLTKTLTNLPHSNACLRDFINSLQKKLELITTNHIAGHKIVEQKIRNLNHSA